ncbi:hypothetical protein NDU88_008915 [Pleurodeles waltl]|uniref:Uncharacterized protein n=1 Tax=Pleurodeles waltl TaxID=8319 RepID=A0AAV7QTB3_PLEWA|nr:hypothetical protein NDU88_008915 [Pleurodeles waltl]
MRARRRSELPRQCYGVSCKGRDGLLTAAREVGARPLSVSLLCTGFRLRRTSTAGGARTRAGPGALLLPHLGERRGVWSQHQRALTFAVGPENARALRVLTEPQFAGGGVGLRLRMAPI